jgi:hypothetical protein
MVPPPMTCVGGGEQGGGQRQCTSKPESIRVNPLPGLVQVWAMQAGKSRHALEGRDGTQGGLQLFRLSLTR